MKVFFLPVRKLKLWEDCLHIAYKLCSWRISWCCFFLLHSMLWPLGQFHSLLGNHFLCSQVWNARFGKLIWSLGKRVGRSISDVPLLICVALSGKNRVAGKELGSQCIIVHLSLNLIFSSGPERPQILFRQSLDEPGCFWFSNMAGVKMLEKRVKTQPPLTPAAISFPLMQDYLLKFKNLYLF